MFWNQFQDEMERRNVLELYNIFLEQKKNAAVIVFMKKKNIIISVR